MMRRLALGSAVAALAIAAGPADAQFFDRLTNPKVSVNLTHPPGLGLQTKRVAFAPARGECADQYLDAVIADFVSNGIEVIDREHLESLLAEHKFALSGYVDQATAAELGKILGPAALAFVKVQRCATDKDSLFRDGTNFRGQTVRTYISRTRAFFKGSLQVVDLATARIFTAKTIDADITRQNEAQGAYPEHPAEFDVLDEAQRNAVEQIHRMFLPWAETRDLYFFDDKDCNLKVAFNLLRGGDTAGALRQSEDNVAACRERADVKPKIRVHAAYNVGMAHFILADYDKALEALNEAMKLGGGEIVSETMADCRRARDLTSEMQRVEARAAVEAAADVRLRPQATGPGTPTGSPTAAASVEERLKKLDEMCKKGLLTRDECARKRAEILKDL